MGNWGTTPCLENGWLSRSTEKRMSSWENLVAAQEKKGRRGARAGFPGSLPRFGLAIGRVGTLQPSVGQAGERSVHHLHRAVAEVLERLMPFPAPMGAQHVIRPPFAVQQRSFLDEDEFPPDSRRWQPPSALVNASLHAPTVHWSRKSDLQLETSTQCPSPQPSLAISASSVPGGGLSSPILNPLSFILPPFPVPHRSHRILKSICCGGGNSSMSFAFSAGVSLRPARHSASPMYEANHRSLRLTSPSRIVAYSR